jgi:hypothetical protein
MHQASVQLKAHRWAAAESTFERVRALGDTLPAALHGQITALVQSGRAEAAAPIARELRSRWPDEGRAFEVHP